MVAQRPTMTLQDIADLTGVRRHVVTMWRGRPRARGRHVPFPTAVSRIGGVERFDRDDVVAYLEETGRGNNAEVRQDAPAVAVPDGVGAEDAVTLLCLRTFGGAELEDLTVVELTDLASRVDPDDRFLAREVRAVADMSGLARYVDDLTATAYGPSDALARLDAGRLRRQEQERGLSDHALAVLGAVTAACRIHLTGKVIALAPSQDDRQLTNALADGFAGISLPDAARAARRRAAIDGIELVDEADGRVRVVSLVGRPERDALQAVDVLVLSLERTEVGVVVGPASVLCDPLLGKAAQDRAKTLGAGNLVMALRLPRGLWKAAHRQSLAVWVLSGVPDGDRPVCLADLETATVDLDDLGSDVLGALAGTPSRAYRYARRVDPHVVLTGVAVLPRGVRATQIVVTDPATRLDRIHAATLTTSLPLGGFDVAVAPAPGRLVPRQRSLGELKASDQVKVLRGNRIDVQLADPMGTVAVLAADGSFDALRLDPFDAARIHPRATRTEAGDVIFLDGRRPQARVDLTGGALVATPSRVLRLRTGLPVGPHALAAIVNATAPADSKWQTWSVPDLSPAERDLLEAVLAAADGHRARVYRRLGALHELVTGLVDGLAAGALTLDPTLTDAKAG